MKIIFLFLATAAAVFADAAQKVTNRQFPDGGGSSRVLDPAKKQAIESFITGTGKLQYRIIYQLDDRLQPLSGVYYNAKGQVFQKSTYKLDGADQIVQEVVYNAGNQLVCTKNYVYGTRNGKAIVVEVHIYDGNGQLKNVEKAGSKAAPRRR